MADEVIETPPANSSPANDVKPAESSPAAESSAESAPAKSAREAFLERVDKAEGRKVEPPVETEEEETEEAASLPTEKEEKPEGAPVEESKKDEPDANADKPADDPKDDLSQSDGAFHQRPEWRKLRELTGDKFKEVRPVLRQMLEREEGLKGTIEKLKHSETVVNRLRTATKGDQGLQDAVGLIEKFDNDPAASVPMLEQLLADARQRGGLEISSADLKPDLQKLDEQLESGIIDQAEYDKQKGRLTEVEKARVKAKDAERRVKATEQTEVQRQQEALVRDRQTALADRERLVWSKDPDFPKVRNLFLDRATKMVEQATAKKGSLLTAEEMVQQADAAWKAIKEEVGALLPKPKPSRATVHNHGSSRSATGQPRTAQEEFEQRVLEREGR